MVTQDFLMIYIFSSFICLIGHQVFLICLCHINKSFLSYNTLMYSNIIAELATVCRLFIYVCARVCAVFCVTVRIRNNLTLGHVRPWRSILIFLMVFLKLRLWFIRFFSFGHLCHGNTSGSPSPRLLTPSVRISGAQKIHTHCFPPDTQHREGEKEVSPVCVGGYFTIMTD